ncbi:MAG: ribosome recycling factor [Dysgonamonadaceae bacterium]|jgi:ribosome recycling factor|nr:ribosome recycling factor [Dysgonamonadaceae bacterium]MDD3728586.1 ribosome recycling factor [Dysgonamonadaceae bacterium]MDD4246346.1 ribosome recycling factor [Dysgonamonadaceae bacterium]MDD4605812.1 ribosome recycling factor [Dysgonamonadaceae bacterium]HUI33490.1 ribosome recycling factor [Dysgonamonadaceae bacterium]
MIDIQSLEKEIEGKMESTLEYLEDTLSRIRAGRANLHILDNVRIDYYGTQSPLTSAATVSTPDAKSILIQPWERSMLKIIEKAILDSDVGITPENNGEVIRLGIPPLTEERRKQLVRQIKQEAEDAKISIRNFRREGMDAIKKGVKDGLPEDTGKNAEVSLQKLHDKYIKLIDDAFEVKEKEVLTV